MHVLYQDDHYVVVNKPAGLLVHRSAIDTRAQVFAVQKTRDLIGKHVYPVHRLDKPTSGVLLFGLSPEAARAASQLFERCEIKKIYRAVVRGYVDQESVIDYPLSWIPETKKEKKRGTAKEAKDAITHFSLLESIELPYPVGPYETSRYSLVELFPKTGRKHQLRRHMKHISHPIIGDTRYGDWRHNRSIAARYHCPRMLLHATSLHFIHPRTEEETTVVAPMDQQFTYILNQMGFAGTSQ